MGSKFKRSRLQKRFPKICSARLSSNLRPTTRECVHLVICGHFRSRDKDGGHTIRSDIAENTMLYRNGLLPIEVLHCRNRDVRSFCSCDLDLDLYELDPRYPGCANM